MGTVVKPYAVSGPQKRSPISLAKAISKTKVNQPRIVIYGQGGIGKTTLAGHFPKPVFVQSPGETGLEMLKQSGQLANVELLTFPAVREVRDESGAVVGKEPYDSTQALTWADVLGAVDALLTQPHDYRTVVFDTLNGLEKLCHQYVCDREYRGEWGEKGFGAYQRGYEVALVEWKGFCTQLDRLREERNLYVVGLCHSSNYTHKNPEGPDYDRIKPDLHAKTTWSYTYGWADVVLYLSFEVHVESTDGKGKKGKAVGGRVRIAHTQYHASFDAKNRHNLPSEIDLGDSGAEAWGNLVDAFKAGKEAIAQQNATANPPVGK